MNAPRSSTRLHRTTAAALLALLALVAVPALAQVSDATRTVLSTGDGRGIGNVRFTEFPTYVLVRVDLTGLAPGYYGLAIHENPECVRPDFASAGAHWDMAGGDHPGHSGDLLPVLVMSDGTANMQYRVDAFRIADVLAGGAAIVLAAEPDNLAHVPDRYQSSVGGPAGPDATTRATGDTGARLACGTVKTK